MQKVRNLLTYERIEHGHSPQYTKKRLFFMEIVSEKDTKDKCIDFVDFVHSSSVFARVYAFQQFAFYLFIFIFLSFFYNHLFFLLRLRRSLVSAAAVGMQYNNGKLTNNNASLFHSLYS